MKSYFKTISLLALAASIFLLVPIFAGGKDDGKLRKLDYSSWIRPVSDTTDIEELLVEEPEPEPEGPDTLNHRILLMGDSMVEGLRYRLAQYANTNGHQLQCVVWYSSSSKYWARGDTIRHFIRKYDPTFIFLSIGANELFVRNLEERETAVNKIVSSVGTVPFVWIGPPNWKEDTGINEIIERVCGSDRYYPSLKLTFTRSKDGCHPDRRGYNMWVDSLSTWFTESSAHPIRWEVPAADAPTTHHLELLRSPKD